MLSQLSQLKAENPGLASLMATIEDAKASGGDVGKLFDGTLIRWLVAYIQAHPEQALAVITWILAMFGVVVPLPFVPAPPPPPSPVG